MIRFFARHPTAANLLMLLFLAMGMLSLTSLQRETMPDFSSTELQVMVVYPGAAAAEVESAICARVEDALDGTDNVYEVVSEAREGIGTITVTMADEGDFVVFLSDVQSAVDGIDDFPSETERPIVERIATFDRVVSVAVTGPMSAQDLRAYSEDLRQRLAREPGIAQVSLDGFGQQQFRIEARAHALARFGMSVQDLAQAVSRQSLDLPAGTLETTDEEITVRFQQERRRLEDFRDLVIRSGTGGGQVFLGDVATIHETFDPPEEKVLYRGQRAGMLRVDKPKSGDSLRVLATVQEFIDAERERVPPQLELALTENTSSIVSDRLDMLVKNGWQGFILVFVAMAVFFGLRVSIWVAMGLPVSFLGALFVMGQIGLSINMLSMVALLLALGLLMDDAIVIAENVATHRKRGKSALDAAIDGVAEVRAGVLSSFLTTVCVLGPLVFIEGDIGKVLYVVPVVLCLVLAVSLIEAFLILPAHLAHSLEKVDPARPGRVQALMDRVMDWMRERMLGRGVDLAVKYRYASFGLTLAALLTAIGLMAGGHVKVQAFPDIDGDVVQCRILLPQGTPLARTERLVGEITAALEGVNQELTPHQPGGAALVEAVSVVYAQNADAGESGPHVATVSGDLLGAELRSSTIDEILGAWRSRVGRPPDVIDLKFTEPAIGPAGRAIELRFQGDDLERLDAAAREAKAWFARFEGVQDLSTDLRPGKPELAVSLQDGTLQLGLDGQLLAGQLRAAFNGVTAATLQRGADDIEVDVRLAAQDRDTPGDLVNLPVTLPSGKTSPLSVFAHVGLERGYARISRRDGRRTVSLIGDVDTNVANTAELTRRFRAEEIPRIEQAHPDVVVRVAGETEEGGKTQRSMVMGMLIGLLGVFVLLSFQFRSYVEPFVVMTAIPFALVGVIGGHWLMGLPLTMPSVLGFVSLSGIVVNDSILLVEFIKIRRRAGDGVEAAARHASRARFRAVLLTSLTTVVGLLPLLAERSPQAQIIIPLAVSIVFGITASTVLVLGVVPCLYTILGDFGLVSKVEVEEAE